MNQATNYTAAAAEWHLDLRASWEVQKNHMKGGVVADADFLLFIMKYPGPISSLANRQTEKEQKKEKTPGAIWTFKGNTCYFCWITADTSLQLRGHSDVKAAGATNRL